MTLITHLKTKNFDIIMGDGRIMGNSGIEDDKAQKVYHTKDKKFLIGYCGDLSYRNNTKDNTPETLKGIMTETFSTVKNLQGSFIETISDSLACNPGEELVIEFITSENGKPFIAKHTKYRASFKEMEEDEEVGINQYKVNTETYEAQKTDIEVDSFCYLPSRFNNDQAFIKAFTDACEDKNVEINEEQNIDKVFDLLEHFYKNKIYSLVTPKQGIGGKITIIIKSLTDNEIETREF